MTKQSGAFWAGICIGVGLFFIRITAAHTWGDFLFALALTVAEFSVVLLWEGKGRQLEVLIEEWKALAAERYRLRGKAQSKQKDLADRQSLVKETDEAIERIERDFERDHLLSDLKALSAIAMNATRGGYRAGIAANAGAVSGGATLEVSDANL